MGNPLTAIGKMMITLRDAVFPLYDNWRVNKKLREKLKMKKEFCLTSKMRIG